MDKLKALQDERATLQTHANDLVKLRSDGQEWTDERAEIDTAKTRGTEIDAEIAQIRSDADAVAFFAKPPTPGSEPQPDAPTEQRIEIPAKARSHRALTAFKFGDSQYDNERAAYVAGHMYLAGLMKRESSADWLNNHGFDGKRIMTEGSNPAGGFLVEDEMQRTLIRLREEYGVFERYANRVPMGSDSMFIPRLLSDVTAYWPGEGAEITASDAGIGGAELVAKKLACLTKVSTELDEDAVVEIGDMITQSCAYAMAIEIDDAAFNGDGTNTYGGCVGLKNALHANATYDAVGDGFHELTLADGHDCIGKVAQYPMAQNVWFMHSAGYWAWCARLQFAGGGNTVSDLGNGPQLQWLGYPVVFVQGLTSTITASTSTIVAYFGDLRLASSFGARRTVNTQISMDRYFENDLIGIKATQRLAINIHERGDTVRNRPIIALKTASS